MTITTIDEARALVGRTFEREGKRRKVVLTNFQGWSAPEPWDIVWCNPRAKSKRVFRLHSCLWSKWARWERGATEVVE